MNYDLALVLYGLVNKCGNSMKNEVEVTKANNKIWYLLAGILFDGIGMLSFSIPFLGEFLDVIWAPISGYLITRMYKGKIGKVAGIFGFIEELLPFSDFIPTFTLTWIYYYFIKGKSDESL